MGLPTLGSAIFKSLRRCSMLMGVLFWLAEGDLAEA
jgi:hypothetical protein